MKSAAVKARPGDKIRLSKIDPDDTGGISKKEVCTRFVDLPEEISLLQEKLDPSLRAQFWNFALCARFPNATLPQSCL